MSTGRGRLSSFIIQSVVRVYVGVRSPATHMQTDMYIYHCTVYIYRIGCSTADVPALSFYVYLSYYVVQGLRHRLQTGTVWVDTRVT